MIFRRSSDGILAQVSNSLQTAFMQPSDGLLARSIYYVYAGRWNAPANFVSFLMGWWPYNANVHFPAFSRSRPDRSVPAEFWRAAGQQPVVRNCRSLAKQGYPEYSLPDLPIGATVGQLPDAFRDRKMTLADNPEIAEPKLTSRSRVTNGSHVLPGVDGRSVWARRFRDLMQSHVADLGGDDMVSEAERSIVRRASALEVELERLELKFATSGEAEAADLDLYQRTSNTMRRHFEVLGLKRRPRDVTPDLSSYVSGKAK